ncbi:MAG: bifunctional DNA-binding transcriptional regulator/O6-methylguanine-DNA methyltransferase Ada [Rhodospirillales bacterium]
MTNKTDMVPDPRWQRVMARDSLADGRFVYAVATTGVYCRPSCSSRRPKPENVRFYDAAEAAEHDGFRPCRRCRPDETAPETPDARLVRTVCQAIADADERLPTLAELGEAAGINPQHLQKRFKRIMGVSPRTYADEVRRGKVRVLLKEQNDVSGALYEAGYGSSSRLYENAGEWLGMTPASYAKGGAGALLRYVITDCPLGRMIVAATERGVAFLGFGDDDGYLLAELQADFPNAGIAADDGRMAGWIAAIRTELDGGAPAADVPLDVAATAFQARVWQALRAIPKGSTMTYGEIAEALGKPKAARAVGRACATNPVSLIVPCHRAVGSSGSLTGYRWGVERKKTLLDHEGSDA